MDLPLFQAELSSRKVLVYHSPRRHAAPPAATEFARAQDLDLLEIPDGADVIALVNRAFPVGILMDGDAEVDSIRLCRLLKADTFSAIVPVVMIVPSTQRERVWEAFEAGADEVLTDTMDVQEKLLRLRMMLHRAHRDVSVHPGTRLPGTAQIERDIAERMRSGQKFAVCYADLDHFKEYNDRYGYNEGDRVIRMLARILRDIVKAYEPDGFIGHIGGDDFIFNVSLKKMKVCCEEVISLFDELIPYQYTEADREAGYFLGRDRRGNILWVPLMTLSIGVVTNEIRTFTHTARVSELATEMKTFAKKQSGSIYAVDRRSDSDTPGQFGRAGEARDELEATTDS